MSKLKAEAKPLSGPLPKGGATGATVSVEPLLGGEVQVPRAFFENPGGRFAKLRTLGVGTPRSKYVWAPVPAFLVTHPTAGPVLVDTAFHSSVAAKPTANLGCAMACEQGSGRAGRTGSAPSSASAGSTLPTRPRRPHPHALDHTSGIAEYPAATFVVSQREGARHHRRQAALARLQPSALRLSLRLPDDRLRRCPITSRQQLRTYSTSSATGSVRLAYTPGHTPGHCSVICRLNDRDLVIAGDADPHARAARRSRPAPAPADMHKWRLAAGAAAVRANVPAGRDRARARRRRLADAREAL